VLEAQGEGDAQIGWEKAKVRESRKIKDKKKTNRAFAWAEAG